MRRLIPSLAIALAFATPAGTAGAAPAASIPTGWSWVTPPAPAATVAVVGDSLTYQAEHGTAPDPYYTVHSLTDELNAAGFATRIAARSGADTRSLRMWGGWQSAPDVIVMALATNDRRWAPTVPPGFPFQLGTSQWNVVPYLNHWPNACPVMVGVTERANKWRHDVYGPAWNRWLAYYASLRHGVFVNWQAISGSHPEWFVDGLHMTEAGRAAYRTAIIDGVERCP